VADYPTDELGQLDEGIDALTRWPKPCVKRLVIANQEGEPSVAWCTRPDAHAGQCLSRAPRVLERNDFMPRRAK
jgi:hypothetical protein